MTRWLKLESGLFSCKKEAKLNYQMRVSWLQQVQEKRWAHGEINWRKKIIPLLIWCMNLNCLLFCVLFTINSIFTVYLLSIKHVFEYSNSKVLLLILKLIVWKPLDKIKLKNDLQVKVYPVCIKVKLPVTLNLCFKVNYLVS